MMRIFLERNGFTVLAASGAAEALEVFAEHGSEIRLLITDVVMPGVSGPELARHLLRLAPELPVLFISSAFDAEFRSGWGGYPRLAKPFAEAELLALVRQAIKKA